MKKLSIVTKIAIRVLFVFVMIAGLSFLTYSWRSFVELQEQNDRMAHIIRDTGRHLLMFDDEMGLNAMMSAFSRAHLVDFYYAKKGDRELFYYNPAGIKDEVFFQQDADEKRYNLGDYYYDVVREGDYSLYIGQKESMRSFVSHLGHRMGARYVLQILFYTLVVTVVAFFALGDIRRLIKSLKTPGARRGNSNLTTTSEGDTLAKGFFGAEQTIDELETRTKVLEKKVLPSLMAEIDSGLTPPYSFNCTMVRVDINKYTTICETHDEATFKKIIDEFFSGVSHITSRYGALIHEFLGDEVIFYVKDTDESVSAPLAMNAVRDIGKLAEDLDARTTRDYGYRFTVKSSLVYGPVTYDDIKFGNPISGAVLRESTRILDQVDQKDRNFTLVNESIKDLLGDLFHLEPYKVTILDGYRKSTKLFEYKATVPLSYHLRQKSSESFVRTSVYRSHGEIAEMLDFVRTNFQSLDQEHALLLLGNLRQFQLTDPSPQVRVSYLNLLEELFAVSRGSSGKNLGFLLPTTIMLAPNLFAYGERAPRVTDVISGGLFALDARVRANVVEVLSVLGPERLAGYDPSNPGDGSSFREVANILSHVGVAEFNDEVTSKLRRMLESRRANEQASGLYALGEISRRIRETDEVAFNANDKIQLMLERALQLVTHSDKMVRRQALDVIRKSYLIDLLEPLLNEKNLPHAAALEIATVLRASGRLPKEDAGKLRRIA